MNDKIKTVCNYLENISIEYEIIEHSPASTIEECKKIEEIIKFKNEINKYSKEELEEELGKLHMKLTQMLMDSDLTTKIALVEAKIEEIKGE